MWGQNISLFVYELSICFQQTSLLFTGKNKPHFYLCDLCMWFCMRARWKVHDRAYNWCETRDKRLLGRDPDRSWCHRYTSVKQSWSQPMAWAAAHSSMEPWARTKKALQYSGDTSSCLGPYLTAACLEFHIGCRLGRELLPWPYAAPRCPCSHGLWPKKFYHTRSVAVEPAPVWFPIQKPLLPSFM